MFVRRLERHLSVWIGLTLAFLSVNALAWLWTVRLLGERAGSVLRTPEAAAAQQASLRGATVAFGLTTLGLTALLVFIIRSLRRDLRGCAREEAALREAKEAAESASRAKDQFLATLSHELRTPLTPVLLSATAALVDPKTPAILLPTFEMIRRNIELEARLIDDLLDVMRIIRGKMPFQFEVVDVHTLIRQAVETCRGEALDKRLDLALDLGATEPYVNGDPARLQQVFWNLIKNAAKFTPEGGRITLRTFNRNERIIVEVTDTGAGIDPELLPRIFNAFEQGANSEAQKLGGLGLGLAICRSVAEAHGGSVTARSEGRNKGATFALELTTVPEALRGTPPARPAVGDSAVYRPRKLLLVEDDPMTLRIMARLLHGVGHDVTVASGYQAALDVARDDIEIVISDIDLPDGSGFDLVQHLRDRYPGLAAIALTGFGMDEDVDKSRAAGFAMHLTKPIDFPRLEAAIESIANGPRP